jgi:hypothetical protein
VRVRRSSLDRRLATGTDPVGDADLARRAEQLTSVETRERIANGLHGDDFVSPRGVAQVAILIGEGSSPLYAAGSSDDVLRHRLAEIAKALG